jgi:uncharacterized iron-regulated membrane protein
MEMNMSDSRARRWYLRVWRWHFYAGLVSLPIVFLLALSGMVYLFKPQIDDWQERGFNRLQLAEAAHPLDEQVAASRQALPDARFKGVELRADPSDAVRILMVRPDGETIRVYVRPDDNRIIGEIAENARFSKIVRNLHGELFAGDVGAILVETFGAWAILLLVSGLFLWWPRQSGLAGILYPRLGGGRRFLRDLHAVTGFWVSIFALFFLISALPWTKVWGGGMKQLRGALAAQERPADWTTGPASEHAMHMHQFGQSSPSVREAGAVALTTPDGISFARVAEIVRPLRLADPVIIAPPGRPGGSWQIKSDAQNRPLRVTIQIDGQSGAILKRRPFESGSRYDRVVGIAIAAHEGQLFGWVNQLLGVVTALGLILMSVSAGMMWWKRRPQGKLGAPSLSQNAPRLAIGLGIGIVVMGCLLPTLGASLLFLLALEKLVLRKIPSCQRWLGLTAPGKS